MPACGAKPLRFLTAGSVDDGKSTLIGRLLLDSRAILADQLDTLEARAGGGQPIDLVAPHRRPRGRARAGHHDRRRLPLLRDARAQVHHRRRARPRAVHAQHGHGRRRQRRGRRARRRHQARPRRAGRVALLPQTRRHALLAQLLRVPHIVFAVNKLDAVADPGAAFELVRDALVAFAVQAGIVPAGIVPISALRGDNVSRPASIAGYDGPTLLAAARSGCPTRSRPSAPRSFRSSTSAAPAATPAPAIDRACCWGRVARGEVAVGDTLAVFPSGETAQVAELHAAGGRVDRVAAGRSAGVVLDRQLDVSRGDWLATPGSHPRRLALSRDARLARHRARRSSAAGTGCATATAGCKAASPRSRAGSTSTRWPPTRPTRSASTRSARWSSRRSSRCRSSPSPANRVAGAMLVVDPATQPHQRRAAGARAADLAPNATPAARTACLHSTVESEEP